LTTCHEDPSLPTVTSPPMLSADVLDTVHGLTQAVCDVRQLLGHIVAGTLDRFARPSSQAVAGAALAPRWASRLFWAQGVQSAIEAHLRTVGLA
jgi:hypothetical protein